MKVHGRNAWQEEKLWGWDDESVFYEAPDGTVIRVQDNPELLTSILALCRGYVASGEKT